MADSGAGAEIVEHMPENTVTPESEDVLRTKTVVSNEVSKQHSV